MPKHAETKCHFFSGFSLVHLDYNLMTLGYNLMNLGTCQFSIKVARKSKVLGVTSSEGGSGPVFKKLHLRKPSFSR